MFSVKYELTVRTSDRFPSVLPGGYWPDSPQGCLGSIPGQSVSFMTNTVALDRLSSAYLGFSPFSISPSTFLCNLDL